jgi:predicted PilT family ATPase
VIDRRRAGHGMVGTINATVPVDLQSFDVESLEC